MQYIGFDLGDGESCIFYSNNGSPVCIPISGKTSFLSAVGYVDDRIVIGDVAVNQNVRNTHVCFKRNFLENITSFDNIIRDFAKGVMDELRNNILLANIADNEDELCYIVGCPAGWNEEDRNRYHDIMVSAGMKNVRIVSESRAAFINACKSGIVNDENTGNDVLLIDFGSSTLDFAYTRNGNQYKTETMGNIILGGGIVDEMIVDYSLEKLKETDPDNASFIEYLVGSCPSQKSKLMVEARKIKEMYFKNEECGVDDNENHFKTPVRIFSNGRVFIVPVYISPMIVEYVLMHAPCRFLDNQSLESRIKNSLISVHSRMKTQPQLVILTGGASRMRFFRNLCKEEFSAGHVVFSNTPESDIAIGLCSAGSTDSRMEVLTEELKRYIDEGNVRKTVDDKIPLLINAIGKPVANSIYTNVFEPLFMDWKKGEYVTLQDLDDEINRQLRSFISGDSFRNVIFECSRKWSDDIIAMIQEKLDSLCVENNLSCTYLKFDNFVFPFNDARNIDFRYDVIDAVQGIFSAIVSVLLAMLCGGTGVALLASGPIGLVLGAIMGLSASFAFHKRTEQTIKNIDFPGYLRGSKMSTINSARNKKRILKTLEKSITGNKKITESLMNQISMAIENTISEMYDEILRSI